MAAMDSIKEQIILQNGECVFASSLTLAATSNSYDLRQQFDADGRPVVAPAWSAGQGGSTTGGQDLNMIALQSAIGFSFYLSNVSGTSTLTNSVAVEAGQLVRVQLRAGRQWLNVIAGGGGVVQLFVVKTF